MTIPTTIEELSTTAASNNPTGSAQRTEADDGLRAAYAFIRMLVTTGSNIASASTITPPSTGSSFNITGTTAITTIASTNSWNGRVICLIFAGALTLTHSSNLALPGSANITTAANDIAFLIQTGSGAWRLTSYLRADGSTAELTAFKASLVSSAGSALVGTKRAISNSVTTLLSAWIEKQAVLAHEFGCIGDDSTNNASAGLGSTDAFANAVTAAMSAGKALVIYPGTYQSANVFDFSQQGLKVYGVGAVVLKARSGSTNAMVVKVDSPSSAAYVNELHNLTIEGNGAATQDGLYQRNYVHVRRSGLRVRNVSRYAFNILGDVLSTWYDCASTINEASMSTTPTHCFLVGGTAQISDTTDVNFVNCFGEGMTVYGLLAQNMAGCTWVGGSFEGMPTGKGISLSSATRGNRFINMFCEANLVGGDYEDYGKCNTISGGTYSSRKATPAYEDVKCIIIRAGAEQALIEGVKGYAVTVESGALSTTFDRCDFDYKVDSADASTRILRTRQLFNTSTIVDDSRKFTGSATYDPANLADGAGATTTVTASGASLGDYVDGVSFSNDLQGITVTGWVSSANTVSVRFQNESGGALDLASGTLRVTVRKA